MNLQLIQLIDFSFNNNIFVYSYLFRIITKYNFVKKIDNLKI